MIRYEASLEGIPVIGEPYTNFNELQELKNVFSLIGWKHTLIRTGRGGYYLFDLETDNNKRILLHTYLKRITFGGRESRPYEKRAQFSAALERAGFWVTETENEYSTILGVYKNEKYPDIAICAWDIKDWGYNVGRAFNCFIDVRTIAHALHTGFAQYQTSAGQIACCFRIKQFAYYLENKNELHSSINETYIEKIQSLALPSFDKKGSEIGEIPNYTELFQLTIDILKNHNVATSIDTIEVEAADILNLSETARIKIHNENEGYRTELGYQLAWARFYLRKSGLVESPKRAFWELTPLGWETTHIDKNEIIKAATKKEIQDDIDLDFLRNVDSENDIEDEADTDNSVIENPFDPNQVDIRTRTMSLDLILKRLRNNAIDMNTSFQRKANLWNITKQSRLIESILVRFPLPTFYFDGSDDNNWLVVDGLQRLSSLDNFVNKQVFGLQNLEFLNQFNGKRFSELPTYLQRRIEEFEITAYIIASGTPKELKFNVFKRINTGGLILTAQEIRNAINQGKPAQFVKKLADLSSFKKATSYTIPGDRMLDQEFVTRFLAFYLFSVEEYVPDLDSFLNKAMDKLNAVNNLEEIEKDFDKAMNTAIDIFGNDAFRKRFHNKDRRKPINKALFEVWSVLLSKQNDDNLKALTQNKKLLKDKFMHLLNSDDNFTKSITSATGDKTRVRKRFAEIENIILSINQVNYDKQHNDSKF